MEISVSPELAAIIGYARDEAMRTGHFGLGVDHLVLGALRHDANSFCSILRRLGVDTAELKRYIDSQVFRPQGIPYGEENRIGLAHSALSALNLSVYEALRAECQQPGAEHLLIAASRCEKNAFRDFLDSKGIDTAAIRDAVAGKAAPARPRKAPMPSAEDIADALEAELRRVMASGSKVKSGIYS